MKIHRKFKNYPIFEFAPTPARLKVDDKTFIVFGIGGYPIYSVSPSQYPTRPAASSDIACLDWINRVSIPRNWIREFDWLITCLLISDNMLPRRLINGFDVI